MKITIEELTEMVKRSVNKVLTEQQKINEPVQQKTKVTMSELKNVIMSAILESNIEEISHGLANAASTKARELQPDADVDPIGSVKRDAQHWNFGSYISPELKPSLDKLGLTKMGNSHGQTQLQFQDVGRGFAYRVVINKDSYNLTPSNVVEKLEPWEIKLLGTVVKKIQAQLSSIGNNTIEQ